MTSLQDILRRKRLARTPGFAGGDLLEQVGNESNQPDAPDVLTERNRLVVTRPRQAQSRPMPDVPNALESAPPDASRRRAVTFDPQTGRPNEDFYREKSDTAGLYGAYRDWKPHGGKRGFKNSLKSGLMMAGEAVRANPDDPVTAALAGFGIGAGGATVTPNFTNRLRRQRGLAQLGGELKSDLDLQKQQAAIDQLQMVEVELENGQRVLVPAKTAATLQSRQQEIGLRGDTLESRKKRWGQLGEHEAAQDAQRLYNSGAADDSAELRAEIAKRLRLPSGTALPPRNSGTQVGIDGLGNYVIINPRSGAVTPTDTRAFAATQEQDRETRSRRATTAANARTQFVQEQTNRRATDRLNAPGRPATVDRTTARKAAQLIGGIENARRRMTRADELLKINPEDADARAMREKAQAEGEGKAAELNALDAGYEAGASPSAHPTYGYPYYKRTGNTPAPGGRYTGQRISTANLPEAAQRLGMTVEQARKHLEDEGATIYE